jgi:hypothetical protein
MSSLGKTIAEGLASVMQRLPAFVLSDRATHVPYAKVSCGHTAALRTSAAESHGAAMPQPAARRVAGCRSGRRSADPLN